MLPLCTYLYVKRGFAQLKPAQDLMQKRIGFYTKKSSSGPYHLDMGVPVLGKTGMEIMVVAKSGDFCITHVGHHFVMPSGDVGRPAVFMNIVTSPLPAKHILRSLWSKSMCFNTFLSNIGRGATISLQDWHIRKMLFTLFLIRKRLRLSFRKAHLLRSVIDAFGFNLVCIEILPNTEEGIFCIRWRRRKWTTITEIKEITHSEQPLFRIMTDNPHGIYTAVGFLHHTPTLFPSILSLDLHML